MENVSFSFLDPEYRRNPHPILHRLRELDPVHKNRAGWLITRHADVVQLQRDPRCGRDLRKSTTGGLTALYPDRKGLGEMIASMMFHLDPPDHTRMRKLMAYAFTPRAIEQMEPQIEQVTVELLDTLPTDGTADLIRNFARPLPVTVICAIMDVPRADFARVEAWTDALIEHLEVTATPEQIGAADQAYFDFKAYLAEFIAARRKAPGNGLVDRLIAAERETEALSPTELIANIILLLIGGHETTTNLIGNGMLALLEHPDQLALLRDKPDLITTAVEEFLRYESPANTNARCPSEDIEIGGKLIKKGERILCMLGAANRDPEVFAKPDTFDITRDPNPHVSFGGGPHFCIGAHLARLEGRIGVRRLLERYRTIDLVPARVKWRDRINLRGLAELGVKLRA